MQGIQMTKRERILSALHYQPVDRLPWSPLVDNYFISSLPSQGIYMQIIEAMRYIGCDIMERIPEAPSRYRDITLRTEECNGITRLYYDTPVGSIYQESRNSGNTNFIYKHLIQKPEDIKIYQYVVEHMEHVVDVDGFKARDAYIGEDGIAVPTGFASPIEQLFEVVSTIEDTVYLMSDYPEEMEELLAVMHQSNIQYYKMLAEHPSEVVFNYEDTSSTFLSPSLYRNYCAPMINDYARILHGAGKTFITHMCGKLSAFSEMIGAGEQDGIDSVCPPSTGDLYPWDAREQWGDRKVIIGGLDPSALAGMSVEQSVEAVREIMDRMPNLQGFILSTGDAVAYGTPIGNLKAITDYLNEKGWFL